MSSIKTLFVIILFTCLGQASFAQGIIKREALTSMDRGVEAMEAGYYEAADQFFRDALSKMTKLPSNLAYYFGRNSYHLGKYKQAINWLNKYVELKGTTGQFNDEVREYLELANEAFKNQREAEIGRTQKQLTTQGYFDCPSDYMHCPLCNGTGVLITPGKFGAVYQTCPYSGLSGKLTCDEYNLYLRGELEKKVE
ncbi:MAG: hypothetical protein R8N23_13405 [Reichenbachiella sp.]|uniref:tetratricopeptide repeat protein n=1 Tax=Reichenbachiella sp. TaxID=2184521 RepID=UPI0029669DD5|nr:hypothetical protein [Reichenbachiella sp.]MDW3210867.1 hypothetical protein [Reichenbachiella sp.]